MYNSARVVMQFILSCYILLFLIPNRGYCDSELAMKTFNESGNDNVLVCFEALMAFTDWAGRDLLIISDAMDRLGNDFFKQHLNIAWKLYSAKRRITLTGFSDMILFTDSFDSLNETLGVIDIRGMDCRAKYVIIVAEKFANLDEISKASVKIPATMWSLDKTRVVYLVPCKEDVMVMTYFPFKRNCEVGDLEVLDIWRQNGFAYGAELFPEKMLDIHDCVQNFSAILEKATQLHLRVEFSGTGKMLLSGVGGRLMTIIAEKIHMKLNLLRYEPDAWVLLADEIGEGKSQFWFSGNVPVPCQLKILDATSTYMQESFAFGYISGGFELPWKNFVWPLSLPVWMFAQWTFVIFCVLVIMANRCCRRKIVSDKLGILDVFGTFLGIARTSPRSNYGRSLFGMWIFYSYVINVAYNSGLVSFLTTPKEKGVINTLDELLADGMRFGGGKFHRESYHDESDPVMMAVYDKFEVWSKSEATSIFLKKQGATGIFTSSVFVFNSNFASHRSEPLRMLTEKAFTFHVPIFTRRGSPFAIPLRRYAWQAIQGGLNNYWLNWYTRNSSYTKIYDKTVSPISLPHLRGIFYFHIAGLSLSCVVFFGELVVHKRYSGRAALFQTH